MSKKETWSKHNIVKFDDLGSNPPALVQAYLLKGYKVVRFSYDKSRDYFCVSDGNVVTYKNKLYNNTKKNNGYLSFRLTSRQRVVAYCFGLLKNLNDWTLVVDHIDGCKDNNDISNLQVITQKENVSKRDSSGHVLQKQIDIYDFITGEFLTTVNSVKDAAEYCGTVSPNVSPILTKANKRLHFKNFTFVYHGDTDIPHITEEDRIIGYHNTLKTNQSRAKRTYSSRPGRNPKYLYIAYNGEGKVIASANGVTSICKILNIPLTSRRDIVLNCRGLRNTTYGYTFERKELSQNK